MPDTLKEIFFSVSQWICQNRENHLPTSQGIYSSAIAGNLYYHLHPETAAEYFERLCISFNLRPAQGRHAARLLEAELYGQKAHTPADLESFVTTLRQLLAKVS